MSTASSPAPAPPSALLALPSELLHQVLAYLSPHDLSHTSRTCRLLHSHSHDDRLWHALVQENLPVALARSSPSPSFRELYLALHPFWFLPRNKLWFADEDASGRLLIVRYDPRRGCIEGYALAAERGLNRYGTLDWGGEVVYHTFAPKVQLDLNQPTLRLDLDSSSRRVTDADPDKDPATSVPAAFRRKRLQSEVAMDVHAGGAGGIFSSFFLSQSLSDDAVQSNSEIWPPLIVPSSKNSRTRSSSPSEFRSPGQKPKSLSEVNESTFRIRQWVEFSQFLPTFSDITFSRFGESVSTYSTLPEESYTPSPAKPWQGIWVGDYSGHGCEFILIVQPDNPSPLPEKAQRAFAAWPEHITRLRFHGWEVERYTDAHRSLSSSSESSFHTAASENESLPYSGRLEAIKLTGDITVPRGEYTFIADDVGPRGLIDYAQESIFHDEQSPRDPAFKGARVVRAVGHIAGRGFLDDIYIPTQLILISENRLAQYWQPFGHVSFYERVDIEPFLTV